jgi:hypothetical protein
VLRAVSDSVYVAERRVDLLAKLDDSARLEKLPEHDEAEDPKMLDLGCAQHAASS